ncbi:hypothetical protein BV898_07848 [Hypsibius exemplaris]|uniref:CUB domain-containing protein n=1 Tax=Hypsibius exemplaris TaxID=2072580 RepID=A0A1W0WSC4_HYPEX|nr:hypothetical protein BV898_07848 [Hypsibius exemplaris]
MAKWSIRVITLLLYQLLLLDPHHSLPLPRSDSIYRGEVPIGKGDGIQWKPVQFKMLKLNATERNYIDATELVPHVWSESLKVNHFLPICDPSPLAAHLMCRTAKHDTFTRMVEVDGTSSTADHYMAMQCKPSAVTIEGCSIHPVASCSRVAEITCGGCGGSVDLKQDDVVTISSPGYPDALFPMVDCEWHFRSPSAASPVTIDFEEFDLPTDCAASTVTVGSLLENEMLLMVKEKHCGSDPPVGFESDSTEAVLRYSSWHGAGLSSDGGHRGFKATVRVKAMKDKMHLGLALGFTAAIMLFFIILAAAYHKRIIKIKQMNEERSKLHTREAVTQAGDDSPDLVYTRLPEPVVQVVRPQSARAPLKTIFHRADLENSSRRAHQSKRSSPHVLHKVSFKSPKLSPSVSPITGTPLRNLPMGKNRPFQWLTDKLAPQKLKEPVSYDGYLGRNVSIRCRSSSLPFLLEPDDKDTSKPSYHAIPNLDHEELHNETGSYRTAVNKSHLTTPRVGPFSSRNSRASGGHPEAFYTPSPESTNSPIPVINLEDCNEDGCRLVKTFK